MHFPGDELEKARRETERLQRENEDLRNRLGMPPAMAAKRMKAYKALGVEIAGDGQARLPRREASRRGQDTLFGRPPGNPPAGT